MRGCGWCPACRAQTDLIEGMVQKVCDGRKPDRLSMTTLSLCHDGIV